MYLGELLTFRVMLLIQVKRKTTKSLISLESGLNGYLVQGVFADTIDSDACRWHTFATKYCVYDVYIYPPSFIMSSFYCG